MQRYTANNEETFLRLLEHNNQVYKFSYFSSRIFAIYHKIQQPTCYGRERSIIFAKLLITPPKKQCANGHEMFIFLKPDKKWRCNIKVRDKQISIRKGTPLEGSRTTRT